MPDPTNESTRAGYAQQDANARLLWQSQRRKANPWDHRGQQLEGEQPPAAPNAPEGDTAAADEPEPTLIAQQDRLRLRRPNQQVENPFESLIEHTLHVKLKDD
jgi:hypothetical protein